MEQFLTLREVCEAYGISHTRVAQLRNGCRSKNGTYRYPPALVAGRDYIYTNKFLYSKSALDRYFIMKKSINNTGVQMKYRIVRYSAAESSVIATYMSITAAMIHISSELQGRSDLQLRLRGIRLGKKMPDISAETERIYFTREGVRVWTWGDRSVDLGDFRLTVEPHEVDVNGIRLCLANSKLSREDFALICGVHPDVISGYLLGNVKPVPEDMEKIVKVLDK